MHAQDSALLGSLLNAEEGLARHPAVGNSLVVGLTLTLTDDDIEAVVTQVAGLSGTLHTVTDDGDDFVFQYFTRFLE